MPGQGAGRRDPEVAGLLQRRGGQRGAHPPGAAREDPPHRGGDVVHRRAAPLGQRGELVEGGAAQQRRRGAVEVVAEGVAGASAVVLLPHQGRHPRRRQPRPGQGRPPLRGAQLDPRVVGGSRRPRRVGLLVVTEQTGGAGHLDQQRRHAHLDLEQLRGAAQLTHPQPAGAQHRRRGQGPRAQQLVHQAHRLRCRGRAPRRDGGRVPGRGGHRRRGEGEAVADAPPAQRHGHLAGQHHGARPRRREQPPGEQPLQRGGGVGGPHLPVRLLHRATRGPPREARQQLDRRRRGAGEQGLEAGGVAEQVRDGAQIGDGVARGGQVEVLQQGRGARRGPQPQCLGQRRTEARRGGSERVGHRPHRHQRVGPPPHQRQVVQPPERRSHRPGLAAPGARHVVGGGGPRPGERGEHLQHLQGGQVEAVEGALHARSGRGARGEGRRVVRDGGGQLRARPDEGGELRGGAGAEVVGEAAGRWRAARRGCGRGGWAGHRRPR